MQIDFKTDKFVVIGSGDTGKSVVNFLNYNGANLLNIFDTRESPPQIVGHVITSGDLDYKLISDATIIVISPGVSIYEPVLQYALTCGKKIIGDIELFAQAIKPWKIPVIGITGSNGKTTVTSLVGFLANSYGINTLVAGNIGTPVLDAFILCEKEHNIPELIVLELSSFQLETTYSLDLASATVLNISEDHLDRYVSLLEYAYIKSKIFNFTKYQVLNADDYLVRSMLRSNLDVHYFGIENAEYSLNSQDDHIFLNIRGENFINVDELMLLGRHNYLNVLAALALLQGLGHNLAKFKPALKTFSGLEHRMQKVIEHKGVLYIEDSKGTNVGAVIAGVYGIDRPIHLILGGDGKGQDFTPLRDLVFNKCKSVALIGQDALNIKETLAGFHNLTLCSSLEDAVKLCIKNAQVGDAVILSPACASWDMFENYKDRAQVFVNAIYANLD